MSRLYLLQQRLFTCNCEIIVSYTHHGRYSHSDVLVSKNRTIINSYSRLPLAVALLVVCPEPARPHCQSEMERDWERERVRKGTCIAFQTAYDNENRNTPNKQHFQWEIRGMVWSMELLTGDKQSECKCNCVTLIVCRTKENRMWPTYPLLKRNGMDLFPSVVAFYCHCNFGLVSLTGEVSPWQSFIE